jgi:hypothetical protein
MTDFLINTVTDMRQGRESWRVFLFLCTLAFLGAVASAVMQ